MKLRTKLLLGYAGFVLALGVLGAWSARTLSQMSAVSGRIIAENYDSVVAAQDMKESLERQDSAALFDLLGQHDRARRQAAEHRARFDAALDEGGGEHHRDRRARGRSRPSGAVATTTTAASTRSSNAVGRSDGAVFRSRSSRSFNAVRADCDRLLRLNQEAMRRKADAASRIARRWFFVTLGAGARPDGRRRRDRAQPLEGDRRAGRAS